MKRNCVQLISGIVFTLVAAAFTPSAKANVYATNIKLNGSITNAVNTSQGSSVTISYILNEAATAGVTIDILSGVTVVRSISIPSAQAPPRARIPWSGTA